MLIQKLILGILSFYIFDPTRIFKNRPYYEIESFIERTYEANRKRKTERKKIRLYGRGKWKPPKKYAEKQLVLKGVQPKDKRYSHHKTIRRMYRNC